MTDKKRLDNFDALRIYAMFLIVLGHYVGHGKLDVEGWETSQGYQASQWLRAVTVIGVDLYVMLTGYFQSTKTFRFSKLWELWGVVIFYSVGIYLLFYFLGIRGSKMETWGSFLPILTRQYWFITCYFALYLFSPYLNRGLNCLEKKDFSILIALLLLFTSLFPTFLPKTMALNPINGQEFIWFVTLYCVGAYYQRYASAYVVKPKISWSIYVLSCSAIYFASAGADWLCSRYQVTSGIPEKIFSYNSPFVFLTSAACFIAFSNLTIHSKLIQRIAPLTLGIYLIHDNNFVRGVLYSKILHVPDWYNSPWFILVSIGSAVLIFSVCAVIEEIRSRIFKLVNTFTKTVI